MNSLALPVVHPAFQRLKRAGRFLHLAAGGLILVHALSHFNQPHSSPVYLGCLLFMAVDIFILVMAGKNIAADLPLVNLFFRLIEIVFFLGIGITALTSDEWVTGTGHILMSLAYIYLFWCEKKMLTAEYVALHHSGITIPALPESRFVIWSNIDRIEAQYDSITITASGNKLYHFDLQKNLQFEELDQIHEFCRHYLKTEL
jgi:protein-S-isoprenylcysteine O-methyltransferase Ste14